MTSRFRLIGYADTVGKGIGFLIPVFDERGKNTLLVQRISDDGGILNFEEVDNVDCQIIYVEPAAVAVGEESIWAFAFAQHDVVAGRAGAFQAALAARVDDPALEERPLLSIELAEFLNLAERRLGLIQTALGQIGKRSLKAAKDWLDLSVLTPDLRNALARSSPRISVDPRRIVASIDGDQVILRGVPVEGESEVESRLKQTALSVLEELSTVYPRPRDGWTIRVMRSSGTKRRTSQPEAVVWLGERKDWEAQTYIQDDFEWRVDAYRFDELEAFREAVERMACAAFAVLRNRQNAISGEIGGLGDRVTTIEIGASNQFRSDRPSLYRSHSSSVHVHVPVPGRAGTRHSPKAVGTIVRQIVASTLAIERDWQGSTAGSELVFFRANGSGPTPNVDAWATLYDRVWSAGLSTRAAYCLAGRQRAPRYDDPYRGRAQEVLFPSSRLLRDSRVDWEMRNSRTDAAILLPVDQRFPEDWTAHAQAIEGMLSQSGWFLRGSTRGPEDHVFEVDTLGKLRFVRTKTEPMRDKSAWNLASLLRDGFDAIDTITVTCDASAPALLTYLHRRGELAVNMRDICSAPAVSGIWSILGTQLRRLSGETSRARSHFMALLIDHAFRHGHVDFEEAGSLIEAVHGPTLGNEIQLSWSRVRQTSEKTRATVRLLANRSNRYLPSGSGLIQPFTITVHSSGIAVSR